MSPAARRRATTSDKQVNSRFTAEELREVDAAAEKDGLHRSAYVRRATLERARGGAVLSDHELADALRALRSRKKTA